MTQEKHFQFKSGKVLSKVQVHLMFWGWDNPKHKNDVEERVKTILGSDYLSQLQQYNNGTPIAVKLGRRRITVPKDPPPTFDEDGNFDEGGKKIVIAQIERDQKARKRIAPDRRQAHLYMIFLRGFEPADKNQDIKETGGKHFRLKDTNIYYAWIRRSTVGDWRSRISVALSEELVETITHPDYRKAGYVTSDNRELCDVCEGLTWRIPGKDGKKGVLVHAYYSEEKDNCVPGPD
jgi:hypothetical protein